MLIVIAIWVSGGQFGKPKAFVNMHSFYTSTKYLGV